MSGLMVTVPAGRGPYQTRTAGGAYLYRVIQCYDAWPFGHDSRVPYGSKSRRRTETFRTLEPVRQRLARANGYAQYQRRNGGDWSAFVAVAGQLTADGWQPLDLDFPGTADSAANACPDPGAAPVTIRRNKITRL